MKTSNRWLVSGLAFFAVFAALAAFKFMQIQAAIAYGESFPEPSESVEAVTASVDTFQKTYSTIGEVVAPESLELRNEVEGRVTAVNFRSGNRVNRNDVLVQLDISEETARLKGARARAELARLDLRRNSQLVEQKLASAETLDRARADRDIAEAEVAALEASIDKKTLRAPFDAVAGIHDLDPGEYLDKNSAIVNLTGISDHAWIDFNVPLEHSGINVGTEIRLRLPGKGAGTWSARIIARDAQASASSRNVEYRARVDGPFAVPVNGVVEVTVPLGEIEQIELPRVALQIDEKGEYVYALEKDPESDGYRARRRPVEVGERNDRVVTLESGVNPGELIAVHGAFKLSPGILTFVRERPDRDSAGE